MLPAGAAASCSDDPAPLQLSDDVMPNNMQQLHAFHCRHGRLPMPPGCCLHLPFTAVRGPTHVIVSF
jgi:hypothetical protein